MLDACRDSSTKKNFPKDFDFSHLAINFNAVLKVAKIRSRLNMPISVCPCDSKDPNRGCVGATCAKEIMCKGKCLCGCFRRTALNKKELKAILAKYSLTVEDFVDFCEEREWLRYLSTTYSYVYTGDVEAFLIYKGFKRPWGNIIEEAAEYLKTDAPMDI